MREVHTLDPGALNQHPQCVLQLDLAYFTSVTTSCEQQQDLHAPASWLLRIYCLLLLLLLRLCSTDTKLKVTTPAPPLPFLHPEKLEEAVQAIAWMLRRGMSRLQDTILGA